MVASGAEIAELADAVVLSAGRPSSAFCPPAAAVFNSDIDAEEWRASPAAPVPAPLADSEETSGGIGAAGPLADAVPAAAEGAGAGVLGGDSLRAAAAADDEDEACCIIVGFEVDAVDELEGMR